MVCITFVCVCVCEKGYVLEKRAYVDGGAAGRKLRKRRAENELRNFANGFRTLFAKTSRCNYAIFSFKYDPTGICRPAMYRRKAYEGSYKQNSGLSVRRVPSSKITH